MALKNFTKIIRGTAFSAICCGFLLPAASANAGFEWVPEQPRYVPEPVMAPEEPMEIESEPLDPLPALEEQDTVVPASPAAQPVETAEPKMKTIQVEVENNEEEKTDNIPPPPPMVKETIISEPITNTVVIPDSTRTEQIKEDDIAVGFAEDMPLALALRQVVPADYAFSFGENVNPGYRVSWSGGKRWDLVVAEMIAPLNLVSKVRGKIVHIKSSEHQVKQVEQPQPQSPPQTNNVLKSREVEKKIEHIENAGATYGDLRRKNITDPGQLENGQHSQTMLYIEKLAKEQKIQETEIEDTQVKADVKADTWTASENEDDEMLPMPSN